jgi:hypothetical protein
VYLRINPDIGPNLGTAVTVDSYGDTWDVLRIGDKVALRGPTGKYLSRCNNCWLGGAYADSAFAHVDNPDGPYSQWKATKMDNGKWVFQSDSGRYLARCYNCAVSSPYPNLVFVHEDNPYNSWVQWALI